MSWAVWITGPPGSATAALADDLARALANRGDPGVVLDVDGVRAVVAPESVPPDGDLDVVARALVYLGVVLTESGVPVVVHATGEPGAWRDFARAAIERFVEIEISSAMAPHADADGRAAAVNRAVALVTADAPIAREALRAGWVIWVTGVPGSGKTTVAWATAEMLAQRGVTARVLEWAQAHDLIAPRGPRETDVAHRALALAAGLLAGAGVPVLVAATAARRAWRDAARARARHFAEVQLDCPAAVAATRERAGRWRLAGCPHRGHAKSAAPDVVLDYEPARAPALTLRTDILDTTTASREVLRLAERLHRAATADIRPPREGSMYVRDLMTRALVTATPEMTVTDARALMSRERIRHLLVTEGGRLVGIVTDRDIRLNLASPATSLSVWELNFLLARLTVGQVMTKSLLVVDPDREAREAARIMLDHRIGALPVLDGERLVGILTESDMVRAFAESERMTAAGR
ncbi:MAG: CBS domain-containing protein [Candidatus Rokubacteria bacterium]|nr:CBS domain-containing protein [Candidatus Rokubacteria bacterium]